MAGGKPSKAAMSYVNQRAPTGAPPRKGSVPASRGSVASSQKGPGLFGPAGEKKSDSEIHFEHFMAEASPTTSTPLGGGEMI